MVGEKLTSLGYDSDDNESVDISHQTCGNMSHGHGMAAL